MKETGKKLRNGKGFTLVEMLIVVAIIAVLVAVSIPLVDASLERTRDAADQANERAAKAAILLAHLGLDDSLPELTYDDSNGDHGYFYDAESGRLLDAEYVLTNFIDIKPYGQCTKEHGPDEHLFASVNYGIGTEDVGEHEGEVLWILIQEDGSIDLHWTLLLPPKVNP